MLKKDRQMYSKEELTAKKKVALLKIAQKLKIKGRSLLKKDQLIKKIIKNSKIKKTDAKPKKLNQKKISPYSAPTQQETKLTQKTKNEIQISQIPEKYHKDTLVLLVRDPYCIYSFWEITEQKIKKAQKILTKNIFAQSTLILRLFNYKQLNTKPSYNDINNINFIGSWYITNQTPGTNFYAEIGYKTPDGQFISLLRSNTVATPNDTISNKIDEKYLISDEAFQKINNFSKSDLNSKSSLEFKEKWQLNLSSEQTSSFSSPNQS